jgi:hypothetical protein
VKFFGVVEAIDAYLLSVPARVRALIILVTLMSMAAAVLPKVPRPFIDYSQWPVPSRISQPDTFGTDTIADVYESNVILNDIGDMYTKEKLAQTPLEAATWSKDASAPYPPAALLALAALHAAGSAVGIGLYGMVALLALLFLGSSLVYFLRTRWYLFPLLYLNFSYFGERFFYVQDGSYLVMLSVVMAALFAARRFPAAAHALMAVAITMKVSPLYHARHVPAMPRRLGVIFAGIVLAGLVAPYFIWDNYLYIFRYNSDLKGDALSAAGALAIAAPMAAGIWYADRRCGFDLEDRIGWNLVPVALFLAFKMNAARHLLLVLLVPDKRGVRNVAVGVGMVLHYLAPSLVPVNAVLPVVTVVLVVGLWGMSGFRSSGVPRF